MKWLLAVVAMVALGAVACGETAEDRIVAAQDRTTAEVAEIGSRIDELITNCGRHIEVLRGMTAAYQVGLDGDWAKAGVDLARLQTDVPWDEPALADSNARISMALDFAVSAMAAFEEGDGDTGRAASGLATQSRKEAEFYWRAQCTLG